MTKRCECCGQIVRPVYVAPKPVVDKYLAGANTDALAKEEGVSIALMRAGLKRSGVSLRQSTCFAVDESLFPEIIRKTKAGVKRKDLAKEYGVSPWTITQCLWRGDYWSFINHEDGTIEQVVI